jgi:hypothetical protein
MSGQPRLSQELVRLVELFSQREVRLRELVEVLHGRGYMLLLFLVSLPFCTPVPLMGLSTPFGLLVAVIGFRLMLRQQPWLPARLLDLRLPPRFLSAVLRGSRRIVAVLEWLLRPRLCVLVDQGVVHHVHGAIILCCGLLLLLPLPIPFTNFMPAVVVVLTAAAILERDGLCAILAGLMFVLTLAFFLLVFWGGAEAIAWLRDTVF